MSIRTSVDRLDPTADVWKRGIKLDPAEPRLREAIARVYRQFAINATDPHERACAIADAEKWSAPA